MRRPIANVIAPVLTETALNFMTHRVLNDAAGDVMTILEGHVFNGHVLVRAHGNG